MFGLSAIMQTIPGPFDRQVKQKTPERLAITPTSKVRKEYKLMKRPLYFCKRVSLLSEDVIHSFFIKCSSRVGSDVLP